MSENENINSMIGEIMKSPEFSALVKNLKSQDGSSEKEENVDIESKIPEISAVVSNLLGDSGGTTQPQTNSTANSGLDGVLGKLKGVNKTNAEKLLSALKPYLNSDRCSMIDKCLSLSKITDIVSAMDGINLQSGR